MPHVDLHTPSELPPPTGYSHVASIPAGCRLVWTSGQVPLKPDGTLDAAPGDWAGQMRSVMHNVGTALEAGGASWNDVFKLTFYVVDTSAVDIVRAVRDEFVNVERPPTSSLVKVAGLVHPDFLVEIEAVAAVPS